MPPRQSSPSALAARPGRPFRATWLASLPLCAAPLAAMLPGTAQAAILTVGGSSGTYSTISAAISAASDGDEIVVATGAYAEDLSIGVDVTIRPATSATVSITGSSATSIVTVSGGAIVSLEDLTIGTSSSTSARGVRVQSSSDVTLSGVTIEDRSITSTGGAVMVSSSTLTVSGCTFTSNTAGNGGALYASASTVTIDLFTAFDSNTASGSAAGGAIYATGSTLTIDDADFDLNAASIGGAIAVYAGSSLTLTGGYVWDGTSTSHGAGVAIVNSDATITDTDFDTNIAAGAGGAIYLDTASTALDLVIDGAVFWDNESLGGGSALYLDFASVGTAVSIDGADFTSNGTTAVSGGAIYAAGSNGTGTLDVTNSTFDANAGLNGIVSVIDSSGGLTVAITDNVFTSNTATSGGGVFLNRIDDYGVVRNLFCDNSVSQTGGAIYISASGTGGSAVRQVFNNEIVENSATVAGGGVYLANASVDLVNNTLLDNDSAIGDHVRPYRSDISATNNIFAWGVSSDAVAATFLGSNSYDFDYNDWYGNNDDMGGDLSASSDKGAHALALDPELQSYAADGTCAYELTLDYASNLVDAGDPSIFDPDGSDSDVGAYGGPEASGWAAWTDADSDDFPLMWDCDDTAATINPDGTEVCDSANADEDCDGLADDDDSSATGKSSYYIDGDSDGYGDITASASAYCDAPTGYVTDHTDCDDSASGVNPGATEVCDASDVDEDCDGLADDDDSSATGKSTWYDDGDGDGYGDLGDSGTDYCDAPSGVVTDHTDCDDAASAVNPGATEVCDASDVDEDCDGLADDADPSVTGTSTWYLDSDSDTFGDASTSTVSCDQPSGYADDAEDCDDTDAAVNPDATEVCGDGTDNDCDGSGGPPADDDGDGLSWTVEQAIGSDDCNEDSDGDGLLDGDEYGTGGTDTDGDGTPDLLDTDDDNDGVPTADEVTWGSDPRATDSDGDGVGDGTEWGGGTSPRDSDGDGFIDALDTDDDDDGILTIEEGTGDVDGDSTCKTVGDGIPNYLDTDSDGDGRPDVEEGTGDLDDDGVPNYLDCNDFDGESGDADGDRLTNGQERILGTNPLDPDSDHDGVGDLIEVGGDPDNPLPIDTDGDGRIDAVDDDDDGDGLLTVLEDRDLDGDPTNDDTDDDGTPDYLDDDDDGDGVPTLAEDRNGNGDYSDDDRDSDGIPDYLDANDEDGPTGDLDGDLLTNQEEIGISDPTNADTDGDGVPDNIEVVDPANPLDSDDDGTLDVRDTDDDGDGIATADEGTVDIDGDGVGSWLDDDSDGDGDNDGVEGTGDVDCDDLPNFLDPDDSDGPCVDVQADGSTSEVATTGGCTTTALGAPGLSPILLGLVVLFRRRRAR